MKLLTPNVFDATLCSSSGDNPGYPASNVQDRFLSRVWQSLTDAGDQYLEFDAGAGNLFTIDSVGIVAHNLPAGCTIKVLMNATDVWTSPSFSFTATWSAAYIYIPLGATQAYRFCRILMQNVAGVGHVQIGRMVGALAWTPTYKAGSNFTEAPVDSTIVTRSNSGQDFADLGVLAHVYTLELVYPDDPSRQALEAIYLALRQATPLLLLVDESNLDKLPPLYCKFDAVPSFTAATAWKWNTTVLRFKEAF
jgi:hypothetical protein